MLSHEVGYQSSSKLTFITEEDNLLASEGFCRDPLCLPLFSLYDVFELLLKHKRISRQAIMSKLLTFHDYLTNINALTAPSSLTSIVSSFSGFLRSHITSDTTFFNTGMISLFAYAFGLRIQLFYVGRGGIMSCQYFGIKQRTVKRLFLSEDSFCLLKKVLIVTNTCSTGIHNDEELGNTQNFTQLHEKQEHWNKNSNKSECIYKLKTSVTKDKKVRRIDEELYSIDSLQERVDIISADFNAIEEVISSMETSIMDTKVLEVPTFTDISHIELTTVTVDTERFLDDWAKDITLNADSTSCTLQPVKTSAVIAGVTHTNVDGMLKFYSEVKEYGFIVTMDEAEIFVHKADLVKQGIETRSLAYYRKFYNIAVRFDIEEYQGKTNKHRKAINMVILSMTPICS